MKTGSGADWGSTRCSSRLAVTAPDLVAVVIAGTVVLYVMNYKAHWTSTDFLGSSWRHVAMDLDRVAEATAVVVVTYVLRSRTKS